MKIKAEIKIKTIFIFFYFLSLLRSDAVACYELPVYIQLTHLPAREHTLPRVTINVNHVRSPRTCELLSLPLAAALYGDQLSANFRFLRVLIVLLERRWSDIYAQLWGVGGWMGS